MILLGRSWWEGGGVNESFESAQDEDDDRNTAAAVAPGDVPPLPGPVGLSALAPPPRKVQDTGDNKGVMTAPSAPASSARVDVRGALKKAESLVKAQKTKKSSNKNKERTLLAGAIVKLLKKDHPPSDGMSANMSMMLMRQMEAINKSMDKRAHRERNNERRERKRCKKRRAKKREKKSKEGSPRREGGSWRQGRGWQQQRH
jgi:hypothetical protein